MEREKKKYLMKICVGLSIRSIHKCPRSQTTIFEDK